MALTQEQIEQLVKQTIEKLEAENPSIKRVRVQAETRKTMSQHGFTQAPGGMKAILPSEIMQNYTARKQSELDRRKAYLKSLGVDTDEL